jgi:glutamyl-Q tRNA(Asp) synthetase
LQWVDRIHGRQSWKREDVGDVILRRADGHWAYHLAVVVDDADQGVTDIVRGADLLGATAAHLALQEMMGVTTPRYAHVPVVVNDQGQKLSKQTLAQPVLVSRATEVLGDVLAHLRQAPVAPDKPDLMLAQATAQWTCPSLTTFHADRGNQTP